MKNEPFERQALDLVMGDDEEKLALKSRSLQQRDHCLCDANVLALGRPAQSVHHVCTFSCSSEPIVIKAVKSS